MQINVQLAQGAALPQRHTRQAAGFDLAFHSTDPNKKELVLKAGEVFKLGTGVALEIPEGFFGLIRLRSGWASQNSMTMVSSGVVDSDYRGELVVPVTSFNMFKNPTIKLGERFAQLLILPVPEVTLRVADFLTETARGAGGFGSTNTPAEVAPPPPALGVVPPAAKEDLRPPLTYPTSPPPPPKEFVAPSLSEEFIKDLYTTSEALVSLGEKLNCTIQRVTQRKP